MSDTETQKRPKDDAETIFGRPKKIAFTRSNTFKVKDILQGIAYEIKCLAIRDNASKEPAFQLVLDALLPAIPTDQLLSRECEKRR